ncbi:MAG: hypothetical protein LBG89_02765 [Rickettsiales bacterium]|jgi:hypothetical protein|nr:hypothetical protein [Rickettsiales bacterium]
MNTKKLMILPVLAAMAFGATTASAEIMGKFSEGCTSLGGAFEHREDDVDDNACIFQAGTDCERAADFSDDSAVQEFVCNEDKCFKELKALVPEVPLWLSAEDEDVSPVKYNCQTSTIRMENLKK